MLINVASTTKHLRKCRFASEVFHDLQEEVMTTAARSHKMIARVQHLEASIPPIEKAVLAQRSHIHFAYTDGMRVSWVVITDSYKLFM